MKTIKFVSALVMSAISLSAAAVTYTSTARITITSTNGTDQVTLREAATYSNTDFDNGGDATKLENTGTSAINIYGIVGGTNYASVAKQDLDNTELGVKTNSLDGSYTMTFSAISGTPLYLVDNETGDRTLMANSGTYVFTAATGATLNNRFFISKSATGTPEICHRYGKLQVTSSNGMTVKVLNMDGSATSIADTNITTNAEVEIDLAGLAAGQYKVEWNSQTLIIDVK